MSTDLYATFIWSPYEISCQMRFRSTGKFHMTDVDAEVSLVDGSSGILMLPEAVGAACLSGLRYGRNALPDDGIQMELIRVVGTYPNGDLTDLATCISEILRFLGESETLVDQAQVECGDWKIHIRLESHDPRRIPD